MTDHAAGTNLVAPSGAVPGTPRQQNGLPPLPRSVGRWARRAAFFGPAFVVSMAYVDPGNFATNTAAGAAYGYQLLWVIVVANVVAMFVQYLSAKLGMATGRSLPELCRDTCGRPLTLLLWVQAEIVAIATDLAELIGGAVALSLLFGVPLIPGVLITAAVSVLLLVLAPRGRHHFEMVLAGMLLVVLSGFLYQAIGAGPSREAAAGLLPGFAGTESVLLASGIVGATVMPHVIYLHSALTRSTASDPARQGKALRHTRREIVVALSFAGLANMTMLVVAAAVFHRDGHTGTDTLHEAHSALGSLLGPTAAITFAVALLVAGLASSSVGTYAGQIIMEGFLRRRIPLIVRRAATMLPAVGILLVGVEPTRALILSQAALSFGIPFALVPLIIFTSRRKLMGALVNRPRTTITAVAAVALICGLNVFLLAEPLFG
ncbi:Divalent metal cation transporter MntH [Streptomyces sp. ADI96-02]|uniref:Nramp family divalent metal transporter n=1 Tax=Streptomyces sp. ADI96-02 TaxID=1522760 RepID=UPI000F54E978|nr:Nramp family divalent metal transporter [Streptomyces sp. ADI96-02]RPK54593.1 Divalent metal cation transporter MntH [Streptomyces sp. ADI96-02]